MKTRRRKSLRARFWAHVKKMPNGCWLWTGARSGPKSRKVRYGNLRDEHGRTVSAHRLSYRLNVGPIPRGKEIAHSCDCAPCVRPRHLRPKSHVENQAEMARKGRARNQFSRRRAA